MKSRLLLVSLSLAIFGIAVGLRAGETGQKSGKADEIKQKAEKLKQDLQLREEILGQQFNDFLLSLLKLKQRLDKGSAEDQERAKILGRALDKARDATITTGFDKLVKILKTKDLGTTGDIKSALKDSQKLSNELQTLLAILREDTSAARLREERLRLEKLIKKLEEVIRKQKVVRGLTDFDKTEKVELKKRQEDVTKQTAEIGREIAKNDPNSEQNKQGKAKNAGAKAGGKSGKGKDAGKTNKGQGKAGGSKDDKSKEPKANAKGSPKKDDKGIQVAKAGGAKSQGGKSGKSGKAGDAKKGGKGGKSGEAGDAKKGGDPNDKKNDKAGDAKKGDGNDSKVKSKGKDDAGANKKNDDKKKGPQANSKSGDKSGKSSPKSGSKAGDPKSGDKAGDPKSGGKSPQGDSKSGKSSSGKGSPKSGGKQSSGSQSKGGQKQGPQQAKQPTGKKQVQDAEYKQHQAEEKIAKGKTPEASDKQGEAIKDLEAAKKKLEDLLRQIREEELERLLAVLIDRCAKMLRMQIAVRDDTLGLQKSIQENAGERVFPADEQKAHLLSDEEKKIVEEADKAIEILEAEGTAVAFPEVFDQVRQDMFNVQKRLKKIGVVADPNQFAEHAKFTKSHVKVTVVIENDIIATLKEMIKALEKAKKDAKSKPGKPKDGQPPPNQNQKLLDLIAELKMIRSMQMRVNKRTKTYAQEYSGEQAGVDHIVTELRNLANRQLRIFEVTNKIAKGDNK